MRTTARMAWMIATVVTVCFRPAPAQQTRPLHPEDVIRRERLDSLLSPDGKSLLYWRISPFVQPGPRFFMVDLVGGEQRELTRQVDPRARIFAWAWSPSGRRIAVAGAIGPATMVWFGDRDSGRLEPITHPPLRTSAQPALVWASEYELMLSTLPDEAIGTIFQAQDLTARQWAKTNAGIEPSRSILESGVERTGSSKQMGAWMLLNLRDGSATSIPDGGVPTTTIAAHNGKAVASVFRISHPRIDHPGLLLDTSAFSMVDGEALALVKVDRGALVARRVEGVVDVVGDGMSWSPDDSKLAFVARRSRGGRERRVFVYYQRGDSLAEMNTEGLSGVAGLAPFAWTVRGSLTVLMSSVPVAGKSPGRPDWWAVRADAPPTNLTAGIVAEPMQMPSRLVAEPAGSLLGVVGSNFWRIDPDGGPPTKLGVKADLHGVSLEWPPDSRVSSNVVVSAQRGDARILGRVDSMNGEFTEIARPSGEALVSDFHPVTGASVFNVQSGRESSLWASTQAGKAPTRVAEANAHLHDVVAPEMKAIHYEDANGRKLHGWLVLPSGFAALKRWPMVAHVYPGTVFSDQAKPWLDDDSELLAGHGYVVLLPSMPGAEGSPLRDPYDELAKQVLPAVDKAIELGIADPKRLGLMGHSFGGYAVYGLVTQTTRFQAAVARAGISDLVSNYGQLNPRSWRGEFPLEDAYQVSWSESGQARLGSPLWKDMSRYIHNSPIQYVGRVETPLLMLHGDLDFVPIQQAEEFFTSLARRGKRARFVRYWGEGHLILSNRANYVDYWQQIYAWFDELLAKPSE
jgi:dipeptidyl aminopeptidase/acylaminoacyl peptidase